MHNYICITRPTTLINLNPDEHNQGLHHYPFMVSLDRCNGNCNTLDALSGRIFVQYETKDANLNVFNIIAKINEAEILIKHASYSCRCGFARKNVVQIKSERRISVDMSAKMQ